MNLLNKCIILTLCILLIENGFCGSKQKMFEKSNLGIQIALNDELNGLGIKSNPQRFLTRNQFGTPADSVQILQKLLNEKSEPANSDQNKNASGSDQTKVGEKPNSDLKAHHPYSESNLGISNALNDGLSALGIKSKNLILLRQDHRISADYVTILKKLFVKNSKKANFDRNDQSTASKNNQIKVEEKPNSDLNDHHCKSSASGSSHEAKGDHGTSKKQEKIDENVESVQTNIENVEQSGPINEKNRVKYKFNEKRILCKIPSIDGSSSTRRIEKTQISAPKINGEKRFFSEIMTDLDAAGDKKLIGMEEETTLSAKNELEALPPMFGTYSYGTTTATGKKMKQKQKHKSVTCQKKLDERKKKWLEMKMKQPAAKKHSSSEEMVVIPTNLPFGEAQEEEEESELYEQTPFISASLGTDNLMRLFQIQFCDEAISIKLEEEKGKNDDQLLAGAIRLGLRNAFCFSFFNSLNLPSAFELKKLGTEEEEFNNKYNHRSFYFHHMLYDAKVEPISKSVKNGTFDLVFRAPYVFKALRAVFDYRSATVTAEELIQSLAQKPLKMFQNPAQSGAKFLQTNDGQFFIKSTDNIELHFFDTFIFERTRSYDDGPIDFFVGGVWYYYEYLRAQILEKKHSLLPKFYALFDLENIQSSEKQSFIMINNIFPSNFPKIHYKFDLKGASMNRKVLKSKDDNPAHKTCRDLDFFRYNPEDKDGTMREGLFRHGICIGPKHHEQLSKTLENDTLFLKSHNITDYSLLLGVHFIDNKKLPAEWLGELPFGVLRGTCDNCKNPFRNEYENDQKLLLSIGIIDTLQTYDFFRHCENAYKSSKSLFIQSEGFLFPPSTRRKYRPNSVKKPNVYRKRFLDAILNVVLRKDCGGKTPTADGDEQDEHYSTEEDESEELFIFRAKKMAESDQPTDQSTTLISPSKKKRHRQMLSKQIKQDIVEDLKKLDLMKVSSIFYKKKNYSKFGDFGQKAVDRAASVPVDFREHQEKDSE